MERFLPVAYIVGWFGAIFMGSYVINWLLIRSIIRKRYRLFVAPGVVVHELSHALGCLVTKSTITDINFWKPSGGHVEYLRPNDPLLRLVHDPIIALAPIWGTFLFLGLISFWLVPDLIRSTYVSDLSIIQNLNLFLDFKNWQTWLYLYLVTSAVATMAPSRTDIKYALESLVVLTLILIILLYWPGFSDLLLQSLQTLRPFVMLSLFFIGFGIIISFILALPARYQRFSVHNQLE